jgi:predicted GIY-YIG superfamily endonuclease
MPYFCYLLRSPGHKGASYIGFSVDPRHRLRQHNGEVKGGARHTSKYAPWDHVCIVSGFLSKTMALMFEWHWQHPARSLVLKKAAKGIKHQGKGPNGKLLLVNALMRDKLWSQCELQINFVETEGYDFFMKLQQKEPVFPVIKATLVRSADIENLAKAPPSYIVASSRASKEHTVVSCCVCKEEASMALEKYLWCCRQCGACQHVLCSAEGALQALSSEERGATFLPESYNCHACKCVWSRSQAAHMTFSPQYLLGGGVASKATQEARRTWAETEELDQVEDGGDDEDDGMSVAEGDMEPGGVGMLEEDPWAQADTLDDLVGSGTQTWANPREECAESSRESFVYDLTQY